MATEAGSVVRRPVHDDLDCLVAADVRTQSTSPPSVYGMRYSHRRACTIAAGPLEVRRQPR